MAETAVSGITLTEIHRIPSSSYSVKWLDDRDQLLVSLRAGYELIDPYGEVILPVNEAISSYEANGYFVVIEERGVNKAGLLDSEGTLVIPYAYSDFTIISDRYCIAVILEETDGDDYDYASGWFGTGSDRYLVSAYDFYDLETSAVIGSLERSDYRRSIKVFPDGFLTEARNGTDRWFDLSLNFVKEGEKSYFSQYEAFDSTDAGIVRAGMEPGELLLEGNYTVSSVVKGDNFCVIRSGSGGYGLMDAQGNIVIPCGEYRDIQHCDGEYAVVSTRDNSDQYRYGIYRIGEGLAVPCEYEKFEWLHTPKSTHIANGYAMAVLDGKVGYVDMNGEVTCPIKYSPNNIEVLGSSFLVTDFDGSYHIIAADGAQTKVDYKELHKYSNNTAGRLIAAQNADDLWGLIDSHGNPVTEFIQSSAYGFSFSQFGDYVVISDKDNNSVVYKIDY